MLSIPLSEAVLRFRSEGFVTVPGQEDGAVGRIGTSHRDGEIWLHRDLGLRWRRLGAHRRHRRVGSSRTAK